jgi:hypothetical protein
LVPVGVWKKTEWEILRNFGEFLEKNENFEIFQNLEERLQ